MKSKDSNGHLVTIGDTIKVLSIDPRLIEYLPEEEKRDLESFVGEILKVESINGDGSMMVSKWWSNPETGESRGHDIAIFPEGALCVST